jgi:hypothetical protein
MPEPQSNGKDTGNGRLDEILRHLQELRSAGEETVRKMNELQKHIEAIREQQQQDARAHEKGRG